MELNIEAIEKRRREMRLSKKEFARRLRISPQLLNYYYKNPESTGRDAEIAGVLGLNWSDVVVEVPKKKAGKEKKKPTKSAFKEEALGLWSKCVRERDGHCLLCGRTDRLQAHHIRSVRHAATRYDLCNGMTLCFPCHSLQHFNPELFHDRIIDRIGAAEYDRLKKKSSEIVKDDIEAIKVMTGHLKNTLAMLQTK